MGRRRYQSRTMQMLTRRWHGLQRSYSFSPTGGTLPAHMMKPRVLRSQSSSASADACYGSSVMSMAFWAVNTDYLCESTYYGKLRAALRRNGLPLLTRKQSVHKCYADLHSGDLLQSIPSDLRQDHRPFRIRAQHRLCFDPRAEAKLPNDKHTRWDLDELMRRVR